MTPGFDISFTNESWIDEGTPFRGLRLTLQDHHEGDQANLTHWSAENYERQWLYELNEIVNSRSKGALITSIQDPIHAFQVFVWTMWKDNDQIRFQNRILFMLSGIQNFDPVHVCDHIGEYKSHDEEGQRLSEWVVPLTAIQDFIANSTLH
jgi:hypothetical protein